MDIEDTSAPIEPVDRYTDWYGFDTENDKDGKVTIAALIHESGASTIWKEAGGFVKWCEKRNREVGAKPVVICHNLEYDLINEFGVAAYSEMQLNYLKGRLISARFGKIRFLDSFNHFRMRLADIGEAIGVRKLDMDINSPEYVTTDSWICLRVMTQARDYIAGLGGQIGATSGSSAMSVWRYMTESEYCTGPHDTPWMRKGYYGGRVEIFQRHAEGPHYFNGELRDFTIEPDKYGHLMIVDGERQAGPWFGTYREAKHLEDQKKIMVTRRKDIIGYDINSMFPFCMLNDFPEYYMEDPTMGKVKGMAEVTISVPKTFTVAPLVHRIANGGLIYPTGVLRGHWTYDELKMATMKGAKILKVHKAIGCNMLVRPFDQFVNTLYKKRKIASNEAERLFLKVLMNALYGKIASKNQVTRTVSRYSLMKSLQEKRIKQDRFDQVKWITYHRGLLDYITPQQDYVNVPWGAMITAYARCLLTKYMWMVPPEKLIYCDTDSLYAINHELAISKELGGMKLEKKVGIMDVYQPKAYRLDDFYRAKGVPMPRLVTDANGASATVDFAHQYMVNGMTAFEAPIRFRASINSRKGKANQWVMHTKGMRTGYQAKPLSGNRYVPPVMSEQLELSMAVTSTKPKQRNTKGK